MKYSIFVVNFLVSLLNNENSLMKTVLKDTKTEILEKTHLFKRDSKLSR